MKYTPEHFTFPWLMNRVVLSGLSILDIPRLQIQTMEDASQFIHAYGFDVNLPDDQKLLWTYFGEAIEFIETKLNDPDHATVPIHLRSPEALLDFRRLLLIASGKSAETDQQWACAILRVMHVIIHLTHDSRTRYFGQVQDQVISRLDAHIHVDSNTGTISLGKPTEDGVILSFFKKKDRKDREREIIKLLHKAEARADQIYDRIGFRLVTPTLFDAVRVLRYLVIHHVISVPNIRPTRSRNWLLDLRKFERQIAAIQKTLESKNVRPERIDKILRKLERRVALRRGRANKINPLTSPNYRAIQFTCRELVRVRNPMYEIATKVEKEFGHTPSAQQIIAEMFPSQLKPYQYVFFPFEVQIMDVAAYADSVYGRSSHEEYQKRQLDVARARVFGRSAQIIPMDTED